MKFPLQLYNQKSISFLFGFLEGSLDKSPKPKIAQKTETTV